MTIKLEISKSETTPLPPVAPPTINGLPQGVLGQIFSNLSKSNLQAAVSVSSSMKTFAIAAANDNEPTSVKNFVQVLCQRLSEERFSEQRDGLRTIEASITSQSFVNLLLLKKYILGVKEQIIDVIKSWMK